MGEDIEYSVASIESAAWWKLLAPKSAPHLSSADTRYFIHLVLRLGEENALYPFKTAQVNVNNWHKDKDSMMNKLEKAVCPIKTPASNDIPIPELIGRTVKAGFSWITFQGTTRLRVVDFQENTTLLYGKEDYLSMIKTS